MKFLIFLCVMTFSGLASASDLPLHRWISVMPDVPLMQNMSEDPNSVLVFDKAEGKIVEITLLSETETVQSVRAFYETVLPQLGWNKAENNLYHREGERLNLELKSLHAGVELRLQLSPK